MSFDNEGTFDGAHGFLLSVEEVLRNLIIDLAHLDGLNCNRLKSFDMESFVDVTRRTLP